jgi:hypothetical protein
MPLEALWAPWIALEVELGLGVTRDPILTLDDPINGQLDFGLLGSPDSPYMDVSCDVRSLIWQSGATRSDGVLTRWEAGVATVVLDNRDGAYDVSQDPTAGTPRLEPMIPLRIRGCLAGDTNDIYLFMGYADDLAMGWDANGDATVTVIATDGTKLLSGYDAPELASPVGDGETSAQRAQRIITEAEWTGPVNITAGGLAMQSTTMAQDSWTQLLLNQDAEMGSTYIAPDGTFTFEPRSVWLAGQNDPTIKQKWGPDDLRYENASVINDDTNLRNIVDAGRIGGTVITQRDSASVTAYQAHRYGRSDLPLKNDADVQDWGNLVLQTSSTPAVRVDGLEVLPQIDGENLFPVVLEAGYGDRWQVTVQTPGMLNPIVRPVQVRGWRHEVTADYWRVTFTLSEAATFTAFQLDSTDPLATLDVMRLT